MDIFSNLFILLQFSSAVLFMMVILVPKTFIGKIYLLSQRVEFYFASHRQSHICFSFTWLLSIGPLIVIYYLTFLTFLSFKFPIISLIQLSKSLRIIFILKSNLFLVSFQCPVKSPAHFYFS